MEGPVSGRTDGGYAAFRRAALKTTEKWWIVNVERRQSIPLSYAIVRLFPGVVPNHVTFLAVSLGLAGCAAVALGGPYAWLGLLGLHAWRILDCVDGEIARAKRMSSALGEYLDNAFDAMFWPLMFVATGIHYWPEAWELGASFVAVAVALYMCRLAILVRSHNLWKKGIPIEAVGGRPSEELARLRESGRGMTHVLGVRLMALYSHYGQCYVIINGITLAFLVDWLSPVNSPYPIGGILLAAYFAPILLMPFGILVGMGRRMSSVQSGKAA